MENMKNFKIPPVITFVLAIVLVAGIDRLTPFLRIELFYLKLIAFGLLATGVFVAGKAIHDFQKARTTVNPMAPEEATSLVDSGVYRYTRNPMYLGMALGVLGAVFWYQNPLGLIIPIGFVWFMSKNQIAREEDAMAENFGAPYEEYKERVRRWL